MFRKLPCTWTLDERDLHHVVDIDHDDLCLRLVRIGLSRDGQPPDLAGDHLTNASCTGLNMPTPACTGPGGYVYDTASSFSNATILCAEFPNPTRFHIAATTYKSSPSSSVAINPAPGGTCGASESGFKINGALTAPTANAGDATMLFLCLSTDTGAGTSGSFTNDLYAELGGNTSITIATAELDTTLSKLKIL